MKTKYKVMLACALTGVLVFNTAACASGSDPNNGNKPSAPAEPPVVEKVYPVNPDTLEQAFGDFHTPLQAAYLLSDYDTATEYASGRTELSRPQAVTLEWEAVPAANTYFVQLATQEDFSDAVTYTTKDTSYDLYNLYLACDYYWRVSDSETTLITAETNTFATTDNAPRNLYLDGVTNVRDLGGWKTEDGGRVKQGMLIRGGRLNTSNSSTFKLELTESGVDVFRNELKIKTELDLRQADNEVGSVDGSVVEGVNYVNIPLIPPPINNPNNIIENNLEQVKKIFELLSDESNYPVYFHCNIGTDRTGFVAFMMNALVGVCEEDLYRDYLFSNFGVVNGERKIEDFKALYADEINKLDGETFADRTAEYLINAGVITAEQVENIRKIML